MTRSTRLNLRAYDIYIYMQAFPTLRNLFFLITVWLKIISQFFACIDRKSQRLFQNCILNLDCNNKIRDYWYNEKEDVRIVL